MRLTKTSLIAFRRALLMVLCALDVVLYEGWGWQPKKPLDTGDRLEYNERER